MILSNNQPTTYSQQNVLSLRNKQLADRNQDLVSKLAQYQEMFQRLQNSAPPEEEEATEVSFSTVSGVFFLSCFSCHHFFLFTPLALACDPGFRLGVHLLTSHPRFFLFDSQRRGHAGPSEKDLQSSSAPAYASHRSGEAIRVRLAVFISHSPFKFYPVHSLSQSFNT